MNAFRMLGLGTVATLVGGLPGVGVMLLAVTIEAQQSTSKSKKTKGKSSHK